MITLNNKVHSIFSKQPVWMLTSFNCHICCGGWTAIVHISTNTEHAECPHCNAMVSYGTPLHDTPMPLRECDILFEELKQYEDQAQEPASN